MSEFREKPYLEESRRQLSLSGKEAYERIYNEKRRTGRTTLCLFKTIVWAYENQGTPVLISDHFATKQSNRRLCKLIKNVLDYQDFKYQISDRGGELYLIIPKLGYMSYGELQDEEEGD